ncbi:MAG: hypothetical protein RL375_2434 [Pseudomonadota bacterium]
MAMNEIGIKLRLDGAAQVQAGAAQAAQAVQSLGNSTKTLGGTAQMTGQQTAQMSAQLQDLFVQIQAGGSPMTALLQQGSQLSAVFGGTGNALKAVASLITPTVGAFAALGTAVGAVGYAFIAGDRERQAYIQSIVTTGNAAGVTATRLAQLAKEAANYGGSRGQGAEVLAQLVASGQVASQVLGRAAEAAVRLDREGVAAIKDTVKAFADLGKDPVEAIKKLNEGQNFLTIGVYKQIQSLQEQGRTTDAARVAQETYAAASTSRMKELESQLGLVEGAWREIIKIAKAGWAAILNIGAPATLGDQFAELQKKLQTAEAAPEGQRSDARKKFIDEARQRVEVLRLQILQEGELAQAMADQARVTQKAIADADELAKRRAKAAEEFKKLAEAGKEIVLGEIAKNGGFDPQLGDQIQKISAAYKVGAVTAEQMRQAMQRIMDSQPYVLERTKAEEKALEDLDKALADITKSRLDLLALSERETDAAAKRVDSLRKETDALRDRLAEELGGKIAKVDSQSLRVAEDIRTAIAEANAAAMDGAPAQRVALMWDQVDALKEQLGLHKAIAEAIKSTEDAKAAGEAAKAWEDAAKDIRDGLTDAFRRSFESGENFGTAMAKTIGNELKARLSAAIAGSLADLVMGFGGFALQSLRSSSSSTVSSGASSLWDLYSTGNKAYSAYSGATTAQQFYAGYQGSSAMMGAGTVGPVTNGAAGATGAGASAASAMSTIGPYAIAAIAYAIGADQMADWSLHLGGYSEARRAGVRNIASEIPGSTPLDAETIAGMAAQGVYIADVQTLSDGMASALFGFADKFAASVKATSPIEATQVVFESDRANNSWGQVKFLGAGNRELSSTGMLTDLNWDADVAAPQLVTRSAAAFSAAMQGSDAADWVKASLAKIPAELERITPEIAKQFEDPLQQAQAVNQALAGMLDGISITFAQLDALDEQLGVLGGAFGQLAGMSSDARNALVQAVGGMEQFQKQTSSYVGNFYTDAEKTALTMNAVGQALSAVGLTLPATREGFRDLVDSQNLSTEAGRKAYAVLMGTADAFASVTTAARSATDILSERTGLERELLQLQGNTAELRARERAQLDVSNRALYDQIRALEDQQTANQAAKDAAKEAADAAADMADAMATLRGAMDTNTLKFLDPAAAEQYRYGVIARDLQASGVLAAEAGLPMALKNKSKQEIFDFARWFDSLATNSIQAKTAVWEAAGALADLKDSAAESAQAVADEWQSLWDSLNADLAGGVRSAYAAVSQQVDAERARVESETDKALQVLDKQADDVRSTFDKLANSLGGLRDAITETIDSIYGAIAGDDGRAAARARLAAVASGTAAFDVDAVRKDVSTASRLDPAAFATRADFARDTARLAGLLRSVNGAVQGQIDSAQAKMGRDLAAIAADTAAAKLDRFRQLTALDDQLATAKAQASSLVRIDEGITSVAGAMAALSSAIAALSGARGQATVTGKWLQSGNTEVWASAAGAVGAKPAGSNVLQDLQIKGLTKNFTGQTAADFIATAAKEGRFMDIYMSAKEQGISLSDVDKLAPWAGWDDGAAERWARATGLPVFAVGTPFVGQTGPALVHEGERIITAADNAALMRIMSGQGRDEALTAEIRALRAEVERLRTENMAGHHANAAANGKTARLLDDVINGGESIQTRAEA